MRLKGFIDKRGALVPMEFKDLPFLPVRAFYVKNVPIGTWRGGHAHKRTSQLLISLCGGIEVSLYDGKEERIFKLFPDEYALVKPMVWDRQKFLTPNATLLVLCDTNYDPDDYITDFDGFSEAAQKLL